MINICLSESEVFDLLENLKRSKKGNSLFEDILQQTGIKKNE